MDLIPFLTSIIWLNSFVLIIYVIYYGSISVFSIKKLKKVKQALPKNKFAVIIPARNEANVIGNLIQSLKHQDYPSDLYEIIVVPNNCTDDTIKVSKASGATILECTIPVTSKGDVLSFTFDKLTNEKREFDAFCIFDADNLVEPDFLKEMNNALCSGAIVAQGYRDSKNPSDSYISACHSIYYYSVNRLYNHARSAIGLSALVNGTGFMFHVDLLKKLGGWHTVTMTEDLEFSALCALHHIKIHWVPSARFYDEQPITFAQSWSQRMRWSKGTMECFSTYYLKLCMKIFRNKSFVPIDFLFLFFAPGLQIINFLSLLATLVLTALKINYHLFPQTDIFFRMFISLDGSYLFPTTVSLIVVILEKKNVRKMLKGILTSWFFIMSWIPINILCLFKRSFKWQPIDHTRSIMLSELKLKNNLDIES